MSEPKPPDRLPLLSIKNYSNENDITPIYIMMFNIFGLKNHKILFVDTTKNELQKHQCCVLTPPCGLRQKVHDRQDGLFPHNFSVQKQYYAKYKKISQGLVSYKYLPELVSCGDKTG